MKDKIKLEIFNFLKKKININLNEIEILNSKNEKFGDYSSNVALRFAKKNNLDSMKLANEIKENINKKIIKKIEILKPGFINFFVDENFLINYTFEKIGIDKKIIFKNQKKEKVNYEFVSANPTGFLHIGHARNAIIGDITINILNCLNKDVTREYYINDAGNQISELGKSVLFYYLKKNNINSLKINESEVGYKGDEIKNFGKKLDKTHIVKIEKNINDVEKIINYFGEISVKNFLEEIKKTLKKINLSDFDVFTSEKFLYDNKIVEKTISELKKSNYFFKDGGASWLKTSKFGDDKDRVIIKSDGSYTYMIADVANHILKYKRKFDKIINLWGSDHHGYENRIKASVEILGKDSKKMNVHYISMVKIMKNNEELKMSKRRGTSLTINDVLEVMDFNILRYSMITKSREQNLIINIDDINRENASNPYWYVQYAYARINSLIKKSNIDVSKGINKFSKIGFNEKKILIKINELFDVLLYSGNNSEPYYLWNYIQELSNLFHSYYGSSKILIDDDEILRERIFFLKMIKNIFSNIFDIFGIKLKNSM